jgi:hypothetical protein
LQQLDFSYFRFLHSLKRSNSHHCLKVGFEEVCPAQQPRKLFTDRYLGVAELGQISCLSGYESCPLSKLGPHHVIILGESHLRRILTRYFRYYHKYRSHLLLAKDAPEPRAIQEVELGKVIEIPEVGGMHHHYKRRAA